LGAEPNPGEFPFQGARGSLFYTAVAGRFEGGKTGFTTCAAVLLNAQKRYVVAPLQCVGQAEEVGCRSAVDVPMDRQLLPADFRQWAAEKSVCKVVRRVPEADLVVLQTQFPLPPKATSPFLREGAVSVGERLWSVGFPEQIPSLLTEGTVATLLTKVRIDKLPTQFSAPLIGVSGAMSEGSAGAGLFDRDGRLVGVIVADARYFDGGFAVTASTLQKLVGIE